MKKTAILLLTGLVICTATMAQTKDVGKDQKVLKNTIKDKKDDKHKVGKDVTHLRVSSAIRTRKEVRRHRRSIHKQGEHLENHGIKHPVTKAKRKAKEDKDIKKGKD